MKGRFVRSRLGRWCVVGASVLVGTSVLGVPGAQADRRFEAEGIDPGRLQGLVLPRPQPRLDPRAWHQPVGRGLFVLVRVLPGQPRVPLGLCRWQQRVSLRSRLQRVQAAP